MKNSEISNPLLPNYEYIPDPEPRIFDDRVYVFGSHDRYNGISFCLNDYVSYSASIQDLTKWRYEGVIYTKREDPNRKIKPFNSLYAPDVIQGLDKNYYLYYGVGSQSKIGVAVSDKPSGKYRFLSYVKHENGSILGQKNDKHQFDPAIFIDDDQRIYLYSGFSPKNFNLMSIGKTISKNGAMVMELNKDMTTLKSNYKYICKTIYNSKNTSFEGHEFFEASSMRKINGKYYFIYSSINNHELCYAISDFPDKDFIYGGVLVSIADIGISEKPLNYTGNTHGSILSINDEHYIFYHRQTNRNQFSRQTCVEKLDYDGLHFKQAEITSQGINGKPLIAKGIHKAASACLLYSTRGTYFYLVIKKRSKYHAYFTQFGRDRNIDENQHIANFSKYTIAGFRYYYFNNPKCLKVLIKGHAKGTIKVFLNEDNALITSIDILPSNNFEWFSSKILKTIYGNYPIYFRFEGKGNFKFMLFIIE
jgi:hypothetical protein